VPGQALPKYSITLLFETDGRSKLYFIQKLLKIIINIIINFVLLSDRGDGSDLRNVQLLRIGATRQGSKGHRAYFFSLSCSKDVEQLSLKTGETENISAYKRKKKNGNKWRKLQARNFIISAGH
jgi:replication initiation and membrane attachment protein DnaB